MNIWKFCSIRPDAIQLAVSDQELAYDLSSTPSKCEYYDITSHNNYFQEAKYKSSFNVISLNIQSCNQNFVHFTSFLDKLKTSYDIIILTETFLTPETNYTYEIDGYKSFSSYKTRHRGGIKLYCKKQNNPEQLNELCIVDELFESVFVKISLKNKKSLVCGGVYRSPSGSKQSFNQHFENNILSNLSNSQDYIIAGDFNLNLLNPQNDRQIEEFSNLMFSKSLFPLITKPTHRNPQTLRPKTLIDHIWSNLSLQSEASIIDYHITHHMATSIHFPELQSNKQITIKFRDYSNENYTKLAQDIDNLLPNLDFTLNPENLTNFFVDWLNGILDQYFPIKTKLISLKRLKSPWISRELLELIDKKHDLFKQYKNGVIDKLAYTTYKNLLNYTLKFAKELYYTTSYHAAKNDIAKSWKITKNLLNKSKNLPHIKLTDNDLTISDPKEVCDKLANHFHTAPITTRNSIPSAPNPIRNGLVVDQSIFFSPATPHDVERIIKDFKNKKASLQDIPVKLFKFLNSKISNLIADIFNHSFETGIYPDSLKIARVVPIHKGGSKNDIKNYRPVSVLSNLNKIFEKLIHSRMSSFLDQNKTINYAQYGFCKGKSTSHATYEVLSKIQPAFTDKMYSICIFADFSKAFDTVDHATLLKNIE